VTDPAAVVITCEGRELTVKAGYENLLTYYLPLASEFYTSEVELSSNDDPKDQNDMRKIVVNAYSMYLGHLTAVGFCNSKGEQLFIFVSQLGLTPEEISALIAALPQFPLSPMSMGLIYEANDRIPFTPADVSGGNYKLMAYENIWTGSGSSMFVFDPATGEADPKIRTLIFAVTREGSEDKAEEKGKLFGYPFINGKWDSTKEFYVWKHDFQKLLEVGQ
jgi:hypothetical protein